MVTKKIQGINLFLCEKTKCYLKESACIKLQKKACSSKNTILKNSTTLISCKDCKQGQEILKKHNVKIKKKAKAKTLVCKLCGQEKPVSKMSHDFKGNPFRVCKQCMSKRNYEYGINKNLEKELFY